MKLLVTGANGFIGKNLIFRLKEENIQYDTFNKKDSTNQLENKLKNIDLIIHLAGVNRPDDDKEFHNGNYLLTKKITDILIATKNKVPIIFTSSIQAEIDNPYGLSKKSAETVLKELFEINGNLIYNFRLQNVFGKWSRPNYNSVVATFCYNIINDIPIEISNPHKELTLIYIDDVVLKFIEIIQNLKSNKNFFDNDCSISPTYNITLGDLAHQLKLFKQSKLNHTIEDVGSGLVRALYSTYISFYKPKQFSYFLNKNEDDRGIFVEMLKTKNAGQFSFFTAHPGITRGGHYHHSKNEKFLVIKGQARFAFRNIVTDEYFELDTNSDKLVVVETVPGWSHDITNIGNNEMIAMIWANEIYDPCNPDTFAFKL
jgi:UDP-2-acetamido-2,6-beta-L-arabino-hexul-4-ose reductase